MSKACFHHGAFFYADEAGFLSGIVPFVPEGADAGEAILVALPRGRLASLRAALNGEGDGVAFVDMEEIGRNPGSHHLRPAGLSRTPAVRRRGPRDRRTAPPGGGPRRARGNRAAAERRRRHAANEIATNSLRHGGGGGELAVWHTDDAMVCDLRDRGPRIEDPLAGRTRPAPDEVGGRGIWLTNQLCDLVQIRWEGEGTLVRLTMGR